MSALSPLIPWTGSKTKPFLIRYSDISLRPHQGFEALVNTGEELLIGQNTFRRVNDFPGIDRDIVHAIAVAADLNTDECDRNVEFRNLCRRSYVRVNTNRREL